MEGFTTVGWRTELIVMAGVTVAMLAATVIIALVGPVALRKASKPWRGSGVSASFGILATVSAMSLIALTVALSPFNSAQHLIYQVEANVKSVINPTNTYPFPQYVVQSKWVKGDMIFSGSGILLEDGQDVLVKCTLEWVQMREGSKCWIAEVG